MSTKRKVFDALTGYRAIAAWMVYLVHFFPYNNAKVPAFFKTFFGGCHIGVDLFFVLSGFLIVYRYYGYEKINFKSYMVNRFARIYPMFFIITLLFFFMKYLSNGWSSQKTIEFLLNITLTKPFFQTYGSSGVVQTWTLTLEELFYISAPLFIILIKKSTSYLIKIPVIIIATGFLLKFLFQNITAPGGLFQSNFSVYIIDFFAGISVAFILLNQTFKLKPVLTYIGIINIVLFLSFQNLIEKYFYYINDDIIHLIKVLLLSFAGIAPLIWGLINEETFVKRFLSTSVMVTLGKASYIFYLIHMGPVANAIYYYISPNKFVIFTVLNVLSIIIYYLIEHPLNLWIRKKFA